MGKLLKVSHVRLVGCHHYAITTTQDEQWREPVFCPQCAVMRQVQTVLTWGRAKCLSRPCTWAYKGRVDRAERMAYGHSANYPSHIVQCWEGPKLLFTTTLAKVQPELPLFELPPPF